MTSVPQPDPTWLIRKHLQVVQAPALPELRRYAAHPASGLRHLLGSNAPPYWAYHWAGGTVLARYILDHPSVVAGRRVLDLGAGSGIVAIAAAKAGASDVLAADIDRHAIAAVGLNATLNGVTIRTVMADLTAGEPPTADVVAVGDLFYERSLAERVTAYLRRCTEAGLMVLVGDPGRAHLPHTHLRRLADYAVPDFGEAGHDLSGTSTVFAFEPRDDRVAERTGPV